MPDPIDLSTYSGDALMGCVLACDDDVDPTTWNTAYDAGLVESGQREPGEWYGWRTPTGDRVLAALRAKLEGSDRAEIDHVRELSRGDGAFSEPVWVAALALHDREQQP